jgi:hypothetical protein
MISIVHLIVNTTTLQPWTDLDSLEVGAAIAIWLSGMVKANKHHYSPKLQVIFTLFVFGFLLGDVFARRIYGGHPSKIFVASYFIFLVALACGGLMLIPKKRKVFYPMFVIGVLLIWFSFFIPESDSVYSYALLVLGFIVVFGSVFMTRLRSGP